MTRFNWAQIEGPEQFQEFAGAYLVHVVSKRTVPFTKSGRDYCIDARLDESADGKPGGWRFQAKSYADFDDLAQTLRGRARKPGEVARILRYLDAPPDDPGFKLWTGVRQYRLLTSLALLPQQRDALLEQLQPLVGRGMEVDVWDGAWLKAKTEEHPLLLEIFFGADPPMFIPLAEFERRQLLSPRGELLRALPYAGRDDAKRDFDALLGGAAGLLLLHGAGGVGKTRALLELARQIDDDARFSVRVVDPLSQDFDRHARSLQDDPSPVIFVDDADELRRDHLERLLVMAASHPKLARRLRLVFAASSQGMARIESAAIRLLGADRVAVGAIEPLDDVTPLLAGLGLAPQAARVVAHMAGGFPRWVVLGADALRRGEEPATLTRDRTIRSELDALLGPPSIERPVRQRVLEVIAAIEPVNVKDDDERAALARAAGTDPGTAARAIEDLVASGIVSRLGRFLRIKPEVLANFVLGSALRTPAGLPTEWHKELLVGEFAHDPRLVDNLARGEWLTGEPLLVDVLRDAKARLPSLDNAERVALLTRLSGASFIRPAETLALVDVMLAAPENEAVRSLTAVPRGLEEFAPVFAYHDVLVRLVAALAGPIALPTHRIEGLQRLATIALRSARANPAATKAFARAVAWSERVDADDQDAALTLASTWLHDTARLPFVVAILKAVLTLEQTDSYSEGWHIVMRRLHGRLTDAVERVRARALNMAFTIATEGDVPERLEAAALVDHAVRELVLGGHSQATVVVSSNGSFEPREDQGEPTSEDDSVRDHLVSIFRSVGRAVDAEADMTVIAGWEKVVNWHAECAPGTIPGDLARELRDGWRARPDYALSRVLLGSARNRSSDAADIAAAVDLARVRVTPKDLALHIGALGARAHGAPEFVEMLVARDLGYASDVCDALIDSAPSCDPHALAVLVAELHVLGGQGTRISVLAGRGNPWRALAAQAAARLQPGWFPRFALSEGDRSLIRELVGDPKSAVWAPIARNARFWVNTEPEFGFEIATILAGHPHGAAVNQVAEVCRDLLKLDSARFMQPVRGLVDALFGVAPSLEDSGPCELLVSLGKDDLGWLLRLFERRTAARGSIEDLGPVPHYLRRILPPAIRGNPTLPAALETVVSWTVGETDRVWDAGQVLVALVGEHAPRTMLSAISVVVGRHPEVGPRLAELLRVFADDDEKFDAFFVILEGVRASSTNRIKETVDGLVGSLACGVITGVPERAPPALVALITRLDKFAEDHPGDGLVRVLVEQAKGSVEGQIRGVIEHDREERAHWR